MPTKRRGLGDDQFFKTKTIIAKSITWHSTTYQPPTYATWQAADLEDDNCEPAATKRRPQHMQPGCWHRSVI